MFSTNRATTENYRMQNNSNFQIFVKLKSWHEYIETILYRFA